MEHAQSSNGDVPRKTRSTVLWKSLLGLATCSVLLYAFSEGPPSEHTGGFGEETCTECHIDTPVNTGPGGIIISGAPIAYMSGVVYPITVRVEDPGADRMRWGFQLSARTQGGVQAGNLTPTDGFTQLAETFNNIQYIEHTEDGTRLGMSAGADFLFNWTAPDTVVGPVVFNAAGNASNASGDEFGDRIYSTALTVPPPPAGPAPAVPDGGIVNNGSFALHPAPLGPGSIAAIFGSNLNDGPPACGTAFADGKLLTSICGVSVKVNDIQAPMFYAQPGQLGIQIPFELAGSNSAQVTVDVLGQTSEPRTIFLGQAAPGIFTVNQQGTGQGAILIANSNILVAPEGSIPGRDARPARRGEIVTIFLTGLGVTSPALETGAPSGGNQTATAATVTIDGLPAVVNFSGTAPGFVGLNQINVTIPEGARLADDVEVVVTLGTSFSNTVLIATGP
ncbi:MAG: hypothetical protein O2795_05095 [Acidobacteria bacterium]|nr:hypothetical protein [Acidobacteriota bacterium]